MHGDQGWPSPGSKQYLTGGKRFITNPFSLAEYASMASNQAFTEVTFTHDRYREFLQQLRDRGTRFRRFSDHIEAGDVLLRHDVDLSIERALAMARLEADESIYSTYCFLVSSPLYNPLDNRCRERIREIADLGHEIGLHFDPHNYWQATSQDGEAPEPDEETLRARVRAEQATLEEVVGRRPGAVSFHRPPSWALDRDFTGFLNTYAPAYYSEITYLADSSQRWRRESPALPDPEETTQILTHPGLWGESDESFDRCVTRGVLESCRFANRWASAEFIDRPTVVELDRIEEETL